MLEKLSVLRDDPLFWGSGGFEPSKDAFNHEAYAQAIYKVISENQPPLSIGLFGPWGIGKSTVVSILFTLIAKSQSTDLKTVYFNAWKYSGDSFRRQFLIEVAKQIYQDRPEKETKVQRLEQLNYTEVLREEDRKGIIEGLKNLFATPVRLRTRGAVRLTLGALVLVIGAILTVVDRSIYPLLATFFSALLVFLTNFKFEDLFLIQENPVYDPKLIFPEQFEAEFRKLVAPDGPLGKAKAVVVIDDIDRCEPATVRDILISIKTFLGNEHCFFIVPCDDKSIVQVFQDPNQKGGYEQELLRKYFNVGVRMAPLMATDLVDFANNISRQTDIPQGVVQMAILANCRDARKMKYFLNSLAVKYGIAKARRESGFMPVDVDKNLPGFAKAVLLEDLYPDLFARLVERPDIYEHLSRAALGTESGEQLDRFGLRNWEKDYPGLKDILKRTRDIKIENIEVFVSLKTTNPEARIPRGFELKNAIVQGDEGAVEDIAKHITTDDGKTNLAELLANLLDTTTDTFLRNTIAASLAFYCRDGQLLPSSKASVARGVSHALLYKEGQQLLSQCADFVLQCINDAGQGYLDELLRKYEVELAGVDQLPEDLSETINSLYRFTDSPASLASVLNKRLEVWLSDERGLRMLLELQLPEGLKDGEKVPSLGVLVKIAAAISPDAKDDAQTLNELRKQVLFKNWDSAIASPLADRLLAMLQQGQSDTGYSKRVAFVVHTIVDNPDCVAPKSAQQLWAHIQNLYARTTDAGGKIEIHEAAVTLAAKCPEEATRQAAMAFVLQSWRSFSTPQLTQVLKFVERFGDPVSGDLQKALITQELSVAQNELQNPTDRTKERLDLCYKYRIRLAPNALDDFLLRTLDSQDAAFTVWSPVIVSFAEKLKDPFPRKVATRALELAGAPASQNKRFGLFRLFAKLLPFVPEDAKPELVQIFFDFCRQSDQNIRNVAVTEISSVKRSVEESEFRRAVNTLARDLFAKSTAEVPIYSPALDAVLKERGTFGEYEWRDLGDLSKRLLEQANVALKDHGLSLVELMSELPKDHEQDLVQQLINIARTGSAAQKEKAATILNGLDISKLDPEPKIQLEEYRKAAQGKKSGA
jgi:KAP family P-loop domain